MDTDSDCGALRLNRLWTQTLLLSVLLASLSTMSTAMHLGLRVREWLDVVLNLRSSVAIEAHNDTGLMRTCVCLE